MLATTLPAPEVPHAPSDGIFWAFCDVDSVNSWFSHCQFRTWLSLGLLNHWLLLHPSPQLPPLHHGLSSPSIHEGLCLKKTNVGFSKMSRE